MIWKKDWIRYHEEVYPSLRMEHLKRVLMNQCLPETIKEKIRFKRTMEEVWKFLDNAIIKQNAFFHGLMLPIINARPVPEKDWKVMEENLELLLHRFEHARELDIMDIVLHISTLKLM